MDGMCAVHTVCKVGMGWITLLAGFNRSEWLLDSQLIGVFVPTIECFIQSAFSNWELYHWICLIVPSLAPTGSHDPLEDITCTYLVLIHSLLILLNFHWFVYVFFETSISMFTRSFKPPTGVYNMCFSSVCLRQLICSSFTYWHLWVQPANIIWFMEEWISTHLQCSPEPHSSSHQQDWLLLRAALWSSPSLVLLSVALLFLTPLVQYRLATQRWVLGIIF